MSRKEQTPAQISTFTMMMIFLVLAISFAAIILAIQAYSVYENQFAAAYLTFIGILGIALSLYTIMQVRRRLARLKIEAPPVITTIECKKCGFKSVREFQRGDYVFKEVEPCRKCNENMIITAIYREFKEKRKETTSF